MDAALAGSLVNFASQMFTNAANTANMRETNQWNERLMNEQNAWNLSQWHRENEYNDPAAQIARLRSAGINPAYAINGGAVDSGEAYAGRPAASATMQSSTAVAPQVDPLALAQARLANTQADLLGSQKKSVDLANNLEELLQNYPIKSTIQVKTDDGSSDTEIIVTPTNIRAKMAVDELRKLGIDSDNVQAGITNMMYNLALLFGNQINPDDYKFSSPESSNNWSMLQEQLKGDKELQDTSLKMAKHLYDVAVAVDRGKLDFDKWLQENKDTWYGKIAVVLRAIFSTPEYSSLIKSSSALAGSSLFKLLVK